MYGITVTSLFLVLCVPLACEAFTPVVIWHGISDTCCNTTITGRLQTHLQEYLPGSHVVSLQIGDSPMEDYKNSLMMHPDEQVAVACDIIKSDPLLADGYNAVGFSQGSQLLRGVAQRCPEPQMKTLITMAGQHQGIYGIPECNAQLHPACDSLRETVNKLVYLRPIQNLVVPATYWHNPLSERIYRRRSTYLADINNERSINQTYITNLQRLENFVMVKYETDTVVQPVESSWFGFYKKGQAKEVESLQESDLYIEDRLGLQQMDKDGKLQFVSNTWEHAELNWPWFRDNIADKYLK